MTIFLIVCIVKIIICECLVMFILYRFINEKETAQSDVRYVKYRKSKLVYLIVFAIISVCSYYNFGIFHGNQTNKSRYIHYPEFFVHYIGPKYFKELGYFNTYNAMAVADAQGENILSDNPSIMNLRNYHYISKKEILENAGYYKSLFSPLRWQEFKSDIASLNRQCSPWQFKNAVVDHGYNASPVWNATASILTNIVGADKIIYLALLDIFLLILMFVVLGYSFGLEIMLVALIFFSVNFISSFYWIGGAFLRYDWLVALVCALSMVHKNKYTLAGIFLSYAAMVKIFPVLFLAGLIVKAAWNIIEKRKLPKKYIKLFVSFALTSVILFAYGSIHGKGIANWKDFTQKIVFHNQTLLANNVGFKMVALYDPSWSDYNKFEKAYGSTKENPFIMLTDVKRAELKQKSKEFVLFSMFFLFLFFLLVKNKDDIEAFVWGIFLIFMLLMPCNYYYSFLFMLAVILYRRKADFANTLFLAVLFLIQIVGYVILLENSFLLNVFYQVSFLLLVYFVGLVAFELYREFHLGRRVKHGLLKV
ncbi:MAG: hypothetical protein PHS93_02170 [Candidatus Omnitrophica bacterium]|nr:hypothetical protein [Candidatus Omnitrophota bacterium]MDD5351958.1 hypothetical protein [Candidatus Omnitrophota bacterium]MDD5550784.1 hypothetical protein [Candidatus Omnitrophota bacterium]